MLERIAVYMDISIDELEKAADSGIDLDESKCVAKISKDGGTSQCVRLRKKTHELCELHFKQAMNGGLKNGQYGSKPSVATASVPPATKGTITARLIAHKGISYFYDYVSSRVYNVDTKALIGIMTDNGLVEINKDYQI